MASEPYAYRNEAVTDRNGNVVDQARFRRNRGEGWENAVFRGTTERGRVRRNARNAAARAASRNPMFGANNR